MRKRRGSKSAACPRWAAASWAILWTLAGTVVPGRGCTAPGVTDGGDPGVVDQWVAGAQHDEQGSQKGTPQLSFHDAAPQGGGDAAALDVGRNPGGGGVEHPPAPPVCALAGHPAHRSASLVDGHVQHVQAVQLVV